MKILLAIDWHLAAKIGGTLEAVAEHIPFLFSPEEAKQLKEALSDHSFPMPGDTADTVIFALWEQARLKSEMEGSSEAERH